MKVQVRYFASIREALGAGETVEIVPGTSIAALRDQLIARGGRHAEALHRQRALRAALDQRMAEEDAALQDGAEVAFFPPVTGG
jgi:molybdopterin synthase sulfur carrier subunit